MYDFYKAPISTPDGNPIYLRVDWDDDNPGDGHYGTADAKLTSGDGRTFNDISVDIYFHRTGAIGGSREVEPEVSWASHGSQSPDYAKAHGQLIILAAEVSERMTCCLVDRRLAYKQGSAPWDNPCWSEGEPWSTIDPDLINEFFDTKD